ncbi:hypothetical protein BD770DRAFT_450677 [Pilaira anomala]|nr:hypothetical protein BD770DRAFT_450677 [Pilaira anomala]
MKSKVSLILLLSLLFPLNSVEAGIFLKPTDTIIIQESVWVWSNSTAITSIPHDVPAKKLTDIVALLNNVPEASKSGTKGVLYNREDSCSPETIEQPIQAPFFAPIKLSLVPKIALIKKHSGPCSLVEKIKNAQKESAIGVIIYNNNQMTDPEDNYREGVPLESAITIPVYYVDYNVGTELYKRLEEKAALPLRKMQNKSQTEVMSRLAVLVSLMPATNIKNTAWELTLFVMLILLGACILFSFLLRIYTWKRTEILHRAVERNRAANVSMTTLPMGKELLTPENLYLFPIRIIDTTLDEEERKRVENVLADEKQREALIQTTLLPELASPPKERFGFSRKNSLRLSTIPPMILKIDTPVNNMCVVCLEAFKIGDEVRKLPCNHEYHTMCIDPWLTSKSCECPLCKYDCSVAKEIAADPYGLIAAASITGIKGVLLRSSLQLKAKWRKRESQVGVADIEQQRRSPPSRISIPCSSAKLTSAVRTNEAVEAPITTAAEIEEHYQAYEEAHPYNTTNQEDETIQSSQSISSGMNETTHNKHSKYEEQDQPPRQSISSNKDDSSMNRTNEAYVSNYAPLSAGSLLPDIDVSSISLCSIDLGGLSEDFHTTFNNQR